MVHIPDLVLDIPDLNHVNKLVIKNFVSLVLFIHRCITNFKKWLEFYSVWSERGGGWLRILNGPMHIAQCGSSPKATYTTLLTPL